MTNKQITYTGIIATLCLIVMLTGWLGSHITKMDYAPNEKTSENYYDYFLRKVLHAQNGYKLEIDSSGAKFNFDVKAYWKVFEMLKLEQGYEIDLHYMYNEDAGIPIFFIIRSGQSRDSLIKCIDNYKYSSDSVLNHIVVADNRKSYYQLLIFDLRGNRFAQYQHSNYSRDDIIVAERALTEIKRRDNDSFCHFTSEQKRAIGKLDYSILYREYPDSVTYNMLFFSPWGLVVILTVFQDIFLTK